MKSTATRPKNSPTSKAQRKTDSGCVRRTSRSASPNRNASVQPVRSRGKTPAAAGRADTAAVRRADRAWLHTALPTQLERDTMLTPEWVAEGVVQEVERFLKAELPQGWAERLAKRAHFLYPRHKHFHKGLNRPGNRGRENLLMFLRHWTAGWLKREHYALYKKLPYSFANGHRLPVSN